MHMPPLQHRAIKSPGNKKQSACPVDLVKMKLVTYLNRVESEWHYMSKGIID